MNETFTTLTKADIMAVSGRVPDGLPVDAIASVVDQAYAAGAEVLVDSDGPHLREAVGAGPDLTKVNRAEAARAAGIGDADPWASAAELRRRGAQSGRRHARPAGSEHHD
jgi:tagatose 6-phosphate kinase